MEVKNPLFLDDPTPVQKGTVIVKSNQQQQKEQLKSQSSNEIPKNSEPATKQQTILPKKTYKLMDLNTTTTKYEKKMNK